MMNRETLISEYLPAKAQLEIFQQATEGILYCDYILRNVGKFRRRIQSVHVSRPTTGTIAADE
jgi:hypothetical protein